MATTSFTITIPGESAVTVALDNTNAVPSITSFIQTISGGVQATTASQAIGSSDTTWNLASVAGLTTGMGAVCGSEVALITAVGASSITVVRARLATTAAAYSLGAAVSFIRSGSYGVYIANLIADVVRANMTAFPAPGGAIATANAAIATQQITIANTVAAGISHTP